MYKTCVIYHLIKPSPFNNNKDRDAIESFAWDLYDMAVARYHEISRDYPDEKFILVEECFSENVIFGGE